MIHFIEFKEHFLQQMLLNTGHYGLNKNYILTKPEYFHVSKLESRLFYSVK